MAYTHLTIKELSWIESYYEQNLPVKTIATKLSRSLQTIYNVINDLKKGISVQDYYNSYTENKKKCGRKKTKLSDDDISYIKEKNSLGWAPDILVHHSDSPLKVSVKTLYRCYKRDPRLSEKSLAFKGKRRANSHVEKRGKDISKLSIHDREKLFPNFENEFGHFEGDSIVGKAHKSKVITLVEKRFKAIITLKPQGQGAEDIRDRIDMWLEALPKHTAKSITFDNGKEFSKWKDICNKHDIYIFFADPGRPSQRGLNENSNGLLRRDGLPKSTDFQKLSEDVIQSVADRRNNIPRRSLGFKSPIEMLGDYFSGKC